MNKIRALIFTVIFVTLSTTFLNGSPLKGKDVLHQDAVVHIKTSLNKDVVFKNLVASLLNRKIRVSEINNKDLIFISGITTSTKVSPYNVPGWVANNLVPNYVVSPWLILKVTNGQQSGEVIIEKYWHTDSGDQNRAFKYFTNLFHDLYSPDQIRIIDLRK
jgi:hypothetical protein